MTPPEYWYRVEDRSYSIADEWGDHCYTRTEIQVHRFEVIKHTPKGVWLNLLFGDRRFVLASANKRFACPTVEEAVASFIARRTRQAQIYEARAKQARSLIERAKRGDIRKQYHD